MNIFDWIDALPAGAFVGLVLAIYACIGLALALLDEIGRARK